MGQPRGGRHDDIQGPRCAGISRSSRGCRTVNRSRWQLNDRSRATKRRARRKYALSRPAVM